MSEAVLLSDEELKIIQKHREAQAKKHRRYENRIKALEIALEYDIWLRDHGRRSSFSTFVNEFGYEEEDSSFMYGVVEEVLEAVDQWG
ncbi:MAG: hypothetical protein M8364_08085 [Methylobacter sp.]|uniref:hypothetical protein n=1 Tax=Methylobacter sp. TaxID=2051955 RepID=UPI00258F3BDD|nr:hypothetical protein [Methylobacter sp.]MCL7420845.1 hypothetical protein [Methylobacter sp.]